MGWFSRKSLGAEARGGVPPWLVSTPEEGGFVRGYAAMLDEVFHRNPVGQRSVRLVASAVGGLTIVAAARAARRRPGW